VQAYNDSMKHHPIRTKALTSCFVALLGEVLGAAIVARRSPPDGERKGLKSWLASLDSRRLAVFGVYGLVITGPFFHWWYGFLESLSASTVGLLGNKQKPQPLLSFAVKLGLNQLVMTPPFLLFTLAYIQYFLSLDVDQTIKAVKRSFAVALFTNWKVWTVAQAINFQLVPLEYRVLFGNLVALWWNIYLSLVNTSNKQT